MSSYLSHHPQEVLLAQFSLYVHRGGLKHRSFHLISVGVNSVGLQRGCSISTEGLVPLENLQLAGLPLVVSVVVVLTCNFTAEF